MKLFCLSVITIIMFSQMSLRANTDTFYIESWKKGKTQVKEETLNLTLDSKTENYSEILSDQDGKKKYKLDVFAGKGSKGIIEWMVEFKELSKDVNLLKPSTDAFQDAFNWQDSFGWFYKGNKQQFEEYNLFNENNVLLPFLSKRIIKIENFYCVLQITDYFQNENEKVVLDSVTLQVQFTNKCNLKQCVSGEKTENLKKGAD